MSTKILNKDILNSLGEGVITIDKNFKITFINHVAEKIIGRTHDEVFGKSCKDVCKSQLCESECPITQVINTGVNIQNLNSRLRCKNGKDIPILLNAAILKDGSNNPAGGILSFRNTNIKDETASFFSNNQYFGMIGKSKSITEIFDTISEISNSDASVFISGETGTGKELIANAIQKSSLRSSRPFIKVNCAVIPHHLLASELFGHVKGAFTDARTDRIGRFEMANLGTIFLDEIAEMPLQMQTQLLRILQDGTFERLGESITKKVDVRIIAATNQNIENAVSQKLFRSDLYFRLNVIPIKVPPLKDRKMDINYLIDYFIYKYNKVYKKDIKEIDNDALDVLMQYNWPGNIRELENVIEYAFIRSKKINSICICGLPSYLRENIDCKTEDISPNLINLQSSQLITILERNNWNQSKVADILGVHRTTIWRKLKKFGIN